MRKRNILGLSVFMAILLALSAFMVFAARPEKPPEPSVPVAVQQLIDKVDELRMLLDQYKSCVYVNEICNGLDDNCNGEIDEGCYLPCPLGQTQCGDKCVDLSTDESYCGSCTTVCSSNSYCLAGMCKSICAFGQTLCGDKCVDLMSDESYCGTCTTACTSGYTCLAGSCTLVCPLGQTVCNGKCVDIQTDEANCGSCNLMCLAGYTCDSGTCTLSCPSPLTKCGSECVNLLYDERFCGSCTTSCASDEYCSLGACKDLIACVPSTELCDNKDNDCDGQVDEGFSNLYMPCSAGTGDCTGYGAYFCSSDGLSTICSATPLTPSTEVCDGKDNDCDGIVDEDLTAPNCAKTYGVCGGSKKTCGGTSGWLECSTADYYAYSIYYETLETRCDGLDNDCDGTADENTDSSCSDGLFCTGVETCTAGICVSPGDPCPGSDNDLDCSETCDEQGESCTANDPNGEACNTFGYCDEGNCVMM